MCIRDSGSGSLRWFELTSNFFRNERDELRAVVTARDVTEQKVAEDALRESEERLRTVVNSAPLVLFAVDRDRRFILAAGEALDAVGLVPEDLIGHSIDEIYADFPSILADVERALAGEEFSSEDRVGDVVFQAHYAPTFDEQGELTGMIGVAYDITSRVRAEEALRDSEETARALLNAPTDGAVLVDRDGTILAMNATAERRFGEHAAKQGLQASDFIGTCVFDLFPPDLRDQRRARNVEVFESGERRHFEDERDGTWTDVTIDPIHDAQGNVARLAIFSRDITDRKRDEAALRKRSRELEALNDYLEKTSSELERSQFELREASEQLAQLLDAEQARAKTDPLTGILNHGAISEVITEAIACEVSFAVAMVDVDGMKAVNDTYGHQTGDVLLLEVTRAISRGGAIVGRFGGDEFLVALLSADIDEADEYKRAVDAALASAQVIDAESQARVPVVASVGIAAYPADAPTLAELIERADERMYAEKRARTGGTGLSSSRLLGDERAARMVGELVPLLTSDESLDDKLRLVAHRLSVGAGYAGVSFDVFAEEEDTGASAPATMSQNAFSKAPEEVLEAWNEHQRSGANQTGVGDILRETGRPLIIPDIATSDYVTDQQRDLLSKVGIRSGMVVPLFSGDMMLATMSVGHKETDGFNSSDERFLLAVAGQVAAIIRMARLVEHQRRTTARLEASRDETVMLLAAAAEAHSQSSTLHFQNVRRVAEVIAIEMGIEGTALRELGLAAALHDIGKIHVPDALLSSPDRVSPDENEAWQLLKEHCIHGQEFLERTSGFELAARVAYTHHERWDGDGYPEGLRGDEIPLESAIIAVADSLDAMMADRAYQPGRRIEEAIVEIVAHRGTQFMPDAVDALERVYRRGELAGIWDEVPVSDEAAAA
jgi:diguanylate cyclase (GGDEF)-like protein/PAS domain S-box-containing protein